MTGNGALTTAELGTIPGTSQQVLRALVPGTAGLRDAFAYRFGKPLGITDSYRPLAVQARIFRERYTTTVLPGRPRRLWNGVWWYQLPGTASAAVPGTSNHGWGTAIDFNSGVQTSLTSTEHLWMRGNAGRFGWSHPAWAHDNIDANGTNEPWHFEGLVVPVDNWVTFPGAGGNLPNPGTPTPIPPPTEVPDMDANDKAVAQATLDAANATLLAVGQATAAAQQATAAANAANAAALNAGVVAARAVEASTAAANLAGRAVAEVVAARGIEDHRSVMLLSELDTMTQRLRTNTARYDKVAAPTYAALATSAPDYATLAGTFAAPRVDVTLTDTQLAAIGEAVPVPDFPTHGTFTVDAP